MRRDKSYPERAGAPNDSRRSFGVLDSKNEKSPELRTMHNHLPEPGDSPFPSSALWALLISFRFGVTLKHLSCVKCKT